MANLTIVVDEQILQRARIRALQHGTSVNAILRDYLASFAGGEDAGVALAEFHDLAGRSSTRTSSSTTSMRPIPASSGSRKHSSILLVQATSSSRPRFYRSSTS